MTKSTFLHAMKNRALSIGNYTLFGKTKKLINWETEEEKEFKSLGDAYENALIGDKPLRQIIDEAETVDNLFAANSTLDDWDIKII